LALKLCKHSKSDNCVQLVTEHSGKGVSKVHKHLIKVHILKKVGANRNQIDQSIQNKNIVIVSNNKQENKLELENEELQTKVLAQKEINHKLKLKILQEEQKETEIGSNNSVDKTTVTVSTNKQELKKKLLKEEIANKELERKILQEEQEKKEIESKLQKVEDWKHDQIKQEISHHAKKCACEHASSAAEKDKCIAACKSRQKLLKKKLQDHVDEISSSCAVKASLACADTKTEDSKQCKKSFIVLCIEEQTKRKQELANLLDDCEDNYSIVYQD